MLCRPSTGRERHEIRHDTQYNIPPIKKHKYGDDAIDVGPKIEMRLGNSSLRSQKRRCEAFLASPWNRATTICQVSPRNQTCHARAHERRKPS